MATSNPSAPAPVSSPRIDGHNHGAAVIIAAGIALGTTCMALALRISQRWPFTKLFKVEDALLIAATISEIGNVASIALAVNLTMHQVELTKRALMASFAITYFTECLSTLSFVIFLRSLNPNVNYGRAMTGLTAAIVAWGVAGIVRVAVASNSAVAPLNKATWIGFAVVWMLVQLTLFASSMWTIWILQMKVARKIGLSVWFSLCLPVMGVTIVRLVYTPTESFSADFTWKDTNMVIISVIESNLAIINAAYPSVRLFLSKVSTGFLVAETAKESKSGSKVNSSALKSKSGSKGNSYALHSIGGGLRSAAPQAIDNMMGNRESGYNISVVKGDDKSDRSFGSEVMMVRRSVEIDDGHSAGAVSNPTAL